MRRLSALALLCLVSCACSDSTDGIFSSGPETAPWAEDVGAILSESIVDPRDDYDLSEPPYSQPVDYAPADVTSVSYGARDGYFYVRLDLDGVIPTGPVALPASGEVEAQTVTGQSFSVVLDTDNNDLTGAGAGNFQGDGGMQGVDIFFGMSLHYGGPMQLYAHYGFPSGDIHFPQGQIEGEYGAGGPGSSFVIARYDISQLDPRFWPAGSTVEIGGWSEAESDLYHEFVNDFLEATSWTLPPAP